eukprot:CAMPEP_0202782604 /NCGR_PEP_ID=MMETSP1388-20130828/62928_1 /ASSEMBLY_ACC=CAM_ASM_000864 /TAXON_ID=37098 /ORGANISM="Isochrysis sp, Strain CCMP1244" /LENGTH=68 /DNA_ID=CAMNT_0049452055 /DNA_START=40 /DNA_END=242 /DNA_ORIENTATION=+
METRESMSALRSVDLPALVGPTRHARSARASRGISTGPSEIGNASRSSAVGGVMVASRGGGGMRRWCR